MSDDPVIAVRNVSKRYKIYAKPWHRAREWLSPSGLRLHHEVWALRDVSFELKRGECLGIIGRNGSGKSTLLKILSGVSQPTSGTASVRGRALALLELGAGFNPELSGRENVIASAELLAFPPGYARARMRDIENFADLGEHFEYPVKTYSSGMFVRLAFSTFLHLEPEVFIVDEALSVGDIFFQQKCAEAIRRILRAGTTMLFVSHDMTAIQNLCHEAILLDEGTVRTRSRKIEAVIADYYSIGAHGAKRSAAQDSSLPGARNAALPQSDSDEALQALIRSIERDSVLRGSIASGDGRVEMVAARVVDEAGRAVLTARIGEWLTFQIVARAHEPIENPTFGVALYDRLNRDVFCIGPQNLGVVLAPMRRGEIAVFSMRVRASVAPGEYTFALAVASQGESTAFHANHVRLGPLAILWEGGELPFYGMAGLDSEYLGDQRLQLR